MSVVHERSSLEHVNVAGEEPVATPRSPQSDRGRRGGAGMVVTAYALPFAGLLLTAGLIGDVKGRKLAA